MRGHYLSTIIIVLLLASMSCSTWFTATQTVLDDTRNMPFQGTTALSETSFEKLTSNDNPQLFLENKGQFGIPNIDFYCSIPGGFIGFAESQVIAWFSDGNERITYSFVGANQMSPLGVSEANHYTNYILGNRGTYTNIRSFNSIEYLDLWDGINLFFEITPKGVKYEFHVLPFSDPSEILIQCEGHERMEVEDSTLKMFVNDVCLVDDGLVVLQNDRVIDSRFDPLSDSIYGFDIGIYDIEQTLVIDPLLYSTYVGGSSDDEAHSISIDDEGNVFVVGETDSANFPLESPYDNETNGALDCFIMKFNSTGNGLIFSTYVGGSLDDFAYSLCVDANGDSFVTGLTLSSDFPTVNALDDSYYDNDEAFVFKLNSTGNGLVYSTFYGGWSDDMGHGIDVDAQGNAHVVLMTGSWDLPAVNAYDDTSDDSWDTYVFKLNSTGNGLLYATYVAGSALDQPYDLTLDDDGNAYVCGRTGVGSFPRVNAYDSTANGDWDVFVYKLNSTGNGLIYSTLVGGNHQDWAAGIALDEERNAYVTGTAWSVNFPQINSIYTPDPGAPFDTTAYVFKLNSTGNGLIYSSLIGHGSALYDCEGNPIEVDSYGNAFVATTTSSGFFPMVNPLMSRPGSYDGVVLQLNATGNGLIYSTWIGGSANDYCRAIAIDSTGTAYVAGRTVSNDFFTESPYDGDLSGTSDAFLAKLTDIGDTSGPEIQLAHSPETPISTDDVTIIASVYDQHGAIAAILEYSINLGVSWQNITMTQSSSIWTGDIPAQPTGTEIRFRVYAKDSRNNWAVSSTDTYTVSEFVPTTTTTSTTTAHTILGLDQILLISVVGVIVLIVAVVVIKRKQS
ncbi:MAG: SBBP repeat-containing protein [Candidatus Thorarchaeota archaeon]